MPVHQTPAHLPTAAALLGWYDAHARALPWRAAPGGAPPDPYRVWLSEVMLQQTTVAAVAPRYVAWLARWPTVAALAAADDADVMAQWAGLGYYARARNLLATARAVAAAGGFPRDAAGLRALAGVGDYTAAAVAAIAFGEPVAVIDGNVERVMARVMALPLPPARARVAIRAALEAMLPRDRPGDFAQATMDLGATICTPRDPACLRCPWSDACIARATGQQAIFPMRAPKPARPTRAGRAWWLRAGDDVLLVRRPPRGLLGGMRALPACWDAGDGGDAAPVAGAWRPLPGVVTHGFTHFELRLTLLVLELPTRPAAAGEWWPVARLAEAGLPTLFARCADAVLAQRASPCFSL